ncbi:MAG: MarR family winged helix-turn-helix transcriptional regulator [Oscillospiraceae bacterium]|nr:MarR family winged helix-turn-helix transcriptional regulator [Oscillospiraceae bacterium]
MDFSKLAEELIQHNEDMQRMRSERPQRIIDESTRGEGAVLRFVFDKDGEDVLPSEISKGIRISTARIAATLNSLEGKSLITRKIDPQDRRKILVQITDAGKEQAAKELAHLYEQTTNMLKHLGEHDAKEYVRIMKKFATMQRPSDNSMNNSNASDEADEKN